LYAKKASEDEEKLKYYYLISVGHQHFLQEEDYSDNDHEFA